MEHWLIIFMLIMIWVIWAASSKCPLGCVYTQPSWWCNYISTPAFLGRVLKCLTSWQYPIRMLSNDICFMFSAESYSNPLAPEGHELDDHRAAQWVLLFSICMSLHACAVQAHECLVTMFVSSGPNWPMTTSGSCWWRHGRRRPPLHPPSQDTMSECHTQQLSKCCGNNGGRSDTVNVFS